MRVINTATVPGVLNYILVSDESGEYIIENGHTDIRDRGSYKMRVYCTNCYRTG